MAQSKWSPPKTCPPKLKQRPVSNPITHFNPTLAFVLPRIKMQTTPCPWIHPFNYYLPLLPKCKTKSPQDSLPNQFLRLLVKFIRLANLNFSTQGSHSATSQNPFRHHVKKLNNPSSAHKFLFSRPILNFSFCLCLKFKFKFHHFI